MFCFSKMPQARELKLQFAEYARFGPLHSEELVIYNVALYALKQRMFNVPSVRRTLFFSSVDAGHWFR